MGRLQPGTKPPAVTIDLSAAWNFERGLGRGALLEFTKQLEGARERVQAFVNGSPAYEFVAAPEYWLADYAKRRRNSSFAFYMANGKSFQEKVDRILVLGDRRFIANSRAMFRACCDPFHNELTRGERGGRPRVWFLTTDAADNDLLAALFELIGKHSAGPHTVETRWGIWESASIGHEPGSPSTYSVREVLLARIRDEFAAQSLDPIHMQIYLPERSDPREKRFTAPYEPEVISLGSVLGVDVVSLIQGAAAVTEAFGTQPVGSNSILDFAGLCYLLRTQRGIASREFVPLVAALEGVREWCELLPRPAEVSAQSLLVQLIPEAVRHDRILVQMPRDKLGASKKLINRPLHDIALENAAAIRAERAAAGLPTAVIHLPAADEASLGQLMQMLLLAAAVEGELNKE